MQLYLYSIFYKNFVLGGLYRNPEPSNSGKKKTSF